MPQREMAVVPDSDLARLLARLTRPDRRTLLALVQMAPGPKRTRMERKFRGRLRELGIT
jgi:hypothetical protein